jgi:hypothetical protein
MLSTDDQPPKTVRAEPQERRLAIVSPRGMGTMIVRSIGPGSVTGRSDLRLHAGECVSLVFEEQQQHAGTVRWVRAPLIGIQPAAPLSAALVQGRIAGTLLPREPRFDIARHALVHHNGAIWDSVIRNVSRHGMLIDSLPDLSPGGRVRIGCGSMPIVAATVRWVHHGQAGLRLAEPIDPARFESTTVEAALNERM